jgi:hypothetical protein
VDDVLLKMDFEKAYDKVKWPLLQQEIHIYMKGFDPKWCQWIEHFLLKGVLV